MLNEKTEIQRQEGSMSDTQNRKEPTQEQDRCIDSLKSTNHIISLSSNEMPSSKQNKVHSSTEGSLIEKILKREKSKLIRLLRQNALCAWKCVADVALATNMAQKSRSQNMLIVSAFLALKESAKELKRMRNAAAKVTLRCQRLGLSNGFYGWIKHAATQRRMVFVAKKIMLRSQNMLIAPAFLVLKESVKKLNGRTKHVEITKNMVHFWKCKCDKITRRGVFCAWKMAVKDAMAKENVSNVIQQICKRHNITLLWGVWKTVADVAMAKENESNFIQQSCKRHNITLLKGVLCVWKMSMKVAVAKLAKRCAFKVIEKSYRITLLRRVFCLWNASQKKLVSTFECGLNVIERAVSVDSLCKIFHRVNPLNCVFRVWNMFKVDVLAKKRLVSSMQYRIKLKRYLVAFRLWKNFGKYMIFMNILCNVCKGPKKLTLMRHFFGEWVLITKKKMWERTILQHVESEDYMNKIVKKITEKGLLLPNQDSEESYDPEGYFLGLDDEESLDSDIDRLLDPADKFFPAAAAAAPALFSHSIFNALLSDADGAPAAPQPQPQLNRLVSI
jgi:hypothetical protein